MSNISQRLQTARVPRKRTRVRGRRFCLTLNNPTHAECNRWTTVLALGRDAEHAQALEFFVCQTERGTSGVLHYQAYVEFKTIVEWSRVKKIFGPRIHVEVSRGSGPQNIIYCTKADSRVVGEDLCIHGRVGTPKRSGSAELVAIDIKSGATLEEIVDKNPGFAMMNLPKVEAFICHTKGHRTKVPIIKIFYGKTGCGKSQYVINHTGYKGAYFCKGPNSSGTVWWGGYRAQSVCVFDDFDDSWFKLQRMLKLFDSVPIWVEPKGSQVPFNSDELVLTTNVDPRDWYKKFTGKPEHKKALRRRIREFCTIYDCAAIGVGGPPSGRSMSQVARTEVFDFRLYGDLDFSIGPVTAGVGDLGSGNHFEF